MEPLRIEISEVAEADIDVAYEWLRDKFGFDSAERWLAGITAKIEQEAALLGSTPARRPAPPEAEQVLGRDLRMVLYRTRGGSPWHILYTVESSVDGDPADTLRVARVRHATRDTGT